MIDSVTANKLRDELGDIQLEIIDKYGQDAHKAVELIEFISNRGFVLVDELEGVIR